jgi:hypothetical protein
MVSVQIVWKATVIDTQGVDFTKIFANVSVTEILNYNFGQTGQIRAPFGKCHLPK